MIKLNIKYIITCFCLGSAKCIWATSNILFKTLDNSEDGRLVFVAVFVLTVVAILSGYSNSYSSLIVDGFPSYNKTNKYTANY